MKKLISIVLALCILGGMFTIGVSAASTAFSDVRHDAWYYEPIMACANAGLVAGNQDGTYAPDRILTWAETIVFAVRLTQYIKGEHVYSAADQTGLWYSIYVDYALENHIVWYVPENVKVAVTRAEAAEIFANVLPYGDFPRINTVPEGYFTDVYGTSDKTKAIYALAEAGIVNGVEKGLFGVDRNFKRSEMATIVARVAGLANKVIIELPRHSPYYIEGLDADTLIAYFAEVCLDTEFGDKQGASVVQKWTQPIYYTIYGTPTGRDMEVLNTYLAQLNSIEGFPGMYPAPYDYMSNLEMYFVDEEEMINLLGSDFWGSWGGVTYWYSFNEIYTEIICQRVDIPQYYRDSIIIEEIYNGLGPVQDTEVRYDSVIYQWSNENFTMSKEDILILEMLYHPDMKPGFSYEQCAALIRELYY
ncbi:MAG: DUF2927 domain-containing protein [Oscillospiraceae bacterium]|nr:DUF2927 domain-containing protein [Oscillospiraceae bacterium]